MGLRQSRETGHPQLSRGATTAVLAQRDQDLAGGQLPRAGGCMNEKYKEPLYAAPPLLARMVDAGRLGRKSGSGFYSY
ncbi:hypothetical protein T261_7108 [Streptomyces lydicus]|nr:hypothetical protein T261_7108 [Streptomyces lydicus]